MHTHCILNPHVHAPADIGRRWRQRRMLSQRLSSCQTKLGGEGSSIRCPPCTETCKHTLESSWEVRAHTHTHTNTHAHTQVYGACYFRCVQVAARIWLPNCSWMPPYFLLNWFQWHAAFCSYSKLQKSRAVSMSGNAVACMVSCIVGFMLLTQHMPLWTY